MFVMTDSPWKVTLRNRISPMDRKKFAQDSHVYSRSCQVGSLR